MDLGDVVVAAFRFLLPGSLSMLLTVEISAAGVHASDQPQRANVFRAAARCGWRPPAAARPPIQAGGRCCRPVICRLVAMGLLVASCGAGISSSAEAHPAVYQRQAAVGGWAGASPPVFCGGGGFYVPFAYGLPPVQGSWYQRPYPYHLDYHRLGSPQRLHRWQGPGAQYGLESQHCPPTPNPAAPDGPGPAAGENR